MTDLPVPLPPELEARLDKAHQFLPWNKAQHEVLAILDGYGRTCMVSLQEQVRELDGKLTFNERGARHLQILLEDAQERAAALEAALKELVTAIDEQAKLDDHKWHGGILKSILRAARSRLINAIDRARLLLT